MIGAEQVLGKNYTNRNFCSGDIGCQSSRFNCNYIACEYNVHVFLHMWLNLAILRTFGSKK